MKIQNEIFKASDWARVKNKYNDKTLRGDLHVSRRAKDAVVVEFDRSLNSQKIDKNEKVETVQNYGNFKWKTPFEANSKKVKGLHEHQSDTKQIKISKPEIVLDHADSVSVEDIKSGDSDDKVSVSREEFWSTVMKEQGNKGAYKYLIENFDKEGVSYTNMAGKTLISKEVVDLTDYTFLALNWDKF